MFLVSRSVVSPEISFLVYRTVCVREVTQSQRGRPKEAGHKNGNRIINKECRGTSSHDPDSRRYDYPDTPVRDDTKNRLQ